MTIYFTSDQHYQHTNILHYCSRPFFSVEDMSQGLIDNHNAIVKPDDTVYHLGDFALSSQVARNIVRKLNGIHHLIPGNHDACYPKHKKWEREKIKYETAGFIIENTEIKLKLKDKLVVRLSHLPYNTYDKRFLDWLPKNDGSWLICGHIHQHWKVKERQINVGVDVWDYKPVHISQILGIIDV